MVDSYCLDGIMYLVTELCVPGDLERYLKGNGILGFAYDRCVIHFAKQLGSFCYVILVEISLENNMRLAAAMVELDRLGIIHRDIKPSNIMLHDARRIKEEIFPWCK